MTHQDIDQLTEKLLQGDRYALSKAITLAESSRIEHLEIAQAIIQRLPPQPIQNELPSQVYQA